MRLNLCVGIVLLITGTLFGQDSRSKFIFDFETTATLPKFKTFQTYYEILENPRITSVNSSLLVGKVSKIPDGSIGWSGIVTETPSGMSLKEGGSLKMKVFATTKMGSVQVKIETDPLIHYEYSVSEISKLNEWEELTFKFKRKSNGVKYSKIVVIFSLGSVEGDVYYFDDVEWIEGGV